MGGRRSSAPIGPPRRPGDERAGALAAARNLSQKKPRTPSPLTVSNIHV